jgi:hypothetical protein
MPRRDKVLIRIQVQFNISFLKPENDKCEKQTVIAFRQKLLQKIIYTYINLEVFCIRRIKPGAPKLI